MTAKESIFINIARHLELRIRGNTYEDEVVLATQLYGVRKLAHGRYYFRVCSSDDESYVIVTADINQVLMVLDVIADDTPVLLTTLSEEWVAAVTAKLLLRDEWWQHMRANVLHSR